MSEPARNTIVILDAVRRGRNSFSKKDLHRETGIAWGTMCKTVDALLAAGHVFARRETPSGRGRPMIPLCVNPESAFFLGVDVGAAQTKLVFCDLAFNAVYKDSVPTPTYGGEEGFLAWLHGVCHDAAGKSGIPAVRLSCMGLAVSGSVDSVNGVLVSGGNFGMRRGANIPVQRLAALCGFRIQAMNAQVAAAWGEYHFGRHAGCANLVTISLGVGIGSGVVIDGRLLASQPTRPVGYIGHLLMPDNSRMCVCGYKGCLEAYSGGRALAAVAAETLPDRPDLHTAQALDLAAATGEPRARAILERAARYNAVGIASMVQLYSPEAIVFAGGQCRKDGFLFTQSVAALKDLLPQERRQSFAISLSSLAPYQSALGAARLAYEQFFP